MMALGFAKVLRLELKDFDHKNSILDELLRLLESCAVKESI